MYYVYMLRCVDNSIYTGITTNISRRMNEHFSKSIKCAKYTMNHSAKRLESLWQTDSRINASKLEFHIKQLSKEKKEDLIINNNLKLLEKIDVNNYKRIDNVNKILD